jgi:hypothetical protein
VTNFLGVRMPQLTSVLVGERSPSSESADILVALKLAAAALHADCDHRK